MAKPLIKWAGSKRLLLPYLVSLLPKDFKQRRLHEPFFGAGVLCFWMEPKSGTANDKNQKLMNFYFTVRDYPHELFHDLKTHKMSRKYYYKARKEYNELVKKDLPRVVERNFDPPHIRLASLFLYLNKMAFNGLYRENTKGEFNVPCGKPTIKRSNLWKFEDILTASKVLKRLNLFCEDFEYVLEVVNQEDIVYLDPPYFSSECNGFARYTNGNGFSLKDQIRLRDLCLELDKQGVYFIVSNIDLPIIRDLYQKFSKFDMYSVKVRRFISGKPEGRQLIGELLVTNIPKEERVGLEKAMTILGRNRKKEQYYTLISYNKES